MSQLIVGQALELLDRKYQFVIESPAESFMLDLQQFIKFLTEDELVKDFTGKILNNIEQKMPPISEPTPKRNPGSYRD